jgi:parallel beta-helix repeat protein
MKTRTRAGTAALTTLLALATVFPVSAGSGTTTRWVDDDGRAGPRSCMGSRTASKTIQAAVNKSDRNDVVIVCPGTYTGIVGITGNRDGLTLRAYTRGTVKVKSPASLVDGPLVWVEDVSGVTVQWLTVSFPSTGCNADPADVQGIWVEDADGTRVLGNVIRTIGTATQSQCGYDDGMRVISSANVRISSNVVRDYKSDGISFEAGSRGRIDGNAMRFYHGKSGSDDDGSQGIRIVDGSRAEVVGNAVRSYPGGNKPHVELGIVVQNGANGSDIHHNKVWYTKTGIGVIGSSAKIRANDVFGVGVQIGIHVVSGTATQVLDNRVQEYQVGIQVDTGGTVLRRNDARDNTNRSCADSTSGSGTAGTSNTWTGNVGSPASSPAPICPAP